MKIVGNTVGMGLPKPNLKQTDPRKGDFVKGKDEIPAKPEDIGAQPAGNYALKTEIPAVPVQSVNGKTGEVVLNASDVGALPASTTIPTKTSQLTNDSGYLTQHQDISGKLDASALPTAINTALAEAKASGEFDGEKGNPGNPGMSASHTWDGSVLTITSASGISSADLKGPKGDSVGIKSITENTESGGTSRINFTDGHALAIKNGIDGHNPVRGVDYYTEADKADIAAQVIEMLGGNPIFGVVDSSNHIVLNGVLPDGTYSVKYEMQDGSTVDIGNLVLDTNVYYSVTNNLTKCTSNNSAKQVIAGGSYSATISANSGYEMSSIKVTMGGADISSSAVSGGKITITSVTGNVVITAVATEKVVEIINLAVTNATNKTDWSLWCNDARIGSDGGYRSATGQVVTNWIEVGIGDTLYIKGLAWTADTHTACIYNSEKAKIHGGTMPYWYNNGYSDFETVNGVTTFRATNVAQNDGIAYVRFGAALTGTLDDVIITKNQPIT